ncbi:hypothetical protein Sjap_010515 [Stephania japonica]|uniref:Uncharacterized protein n=1 Tax=Stephania japonica TaxID=461633 RepID=A0AAP0P486_9MAGN
MQRVPEEVVRGGAGKKLTRVGSFGRGFGNLVKWSGDLCNRVKGSIRGGKILEIEYLLAQIEDRRVCFGAYTRSMGDYIPTSPTALSPQICLLTVDYCPDVSNYNEGRTVQEIEPVFEPLLTHHASLGREREFRSRLVLLTGGLVRFHFGMAGVTESAIMGYLPRVLMNVYVWRLGCHAATGAVTSETWQRLHCVEKTLCPTRMWVTPWEILRTSSIVVKEKVHIRETVHIEPKLERIKIRIRSECRRCRHDHDDPLAVPQATAVAGSGAAKTITLTVYKTSSKRGYNVIHSYLYTYIRVGGALGSVELR